MRRFFPTLPALSAWGLVAGLAATSVVAPSARANELISPEKLSTLTWAYALNSKWLKLKACGRFRPGETDKCAEVKLLNTMTTGRAIDRALQMLRVPRDKLGVVIKEAGGKFEIIGITAELLSAPGIGERPAKAPTVELSGESLSQVLWIQLLATRTVTVKVCGKVANPDRS